MAKHEHVSRRAKIFEFFLSPFVANEILFNVTALSVKLMIPPVSELRIKWLGSFYFSLIGLSLSFQFAFGITRIWFLLFSLYVLYVLTSRYRD